MGKAIAQGLAAEGAKLIICARGKDALETTEQELRAAGAEVLAHACDVSDQQALAALVETANATYGRLDILVNNAGGPPVGSFLQHDDSAFQQALELNLLSIVRLSRLVAPGMQERQWGRIINITSSKGGWLLLRKSISMRVRLEV